MSDLVGMSRTAEGLRVARDRLAEIAAALPDPVSPQGFSAAEVADLTCIASLIAEAALLREESRGCHARLDFPERDDERWRSRIVLSHGAPHRLLPVGPEGA
jgi:L-aspartate oxidase